METPVMESKSISLKRYGIESKQVHYQTAPDELQQHTLRRGEGVETANGVLAINTGRFTGRSPKDRYIVIDDVTRDKVNWGSVNIPFDSVKFDKLYARVAAHLSTKEVYVRDAYACTEESYKLNIRAITQTPWAGLFVHNMFLRPEETALENFKEDWLILNAPDFYAFPEWDGTSRNNFSIINFTRKIILIGGTGYTGEIKKGIFSVLNMLLPTEHNVLPMHCSANQGEDGDTAIFFGLSGTGKTTLSTDSNRTLIGDDEHGWTPKNSIFNFEGGCYAKVIGLSQEKEPEIFDAIRLGAMLENVVLTENGAVAFNDDSITKNTRVSYPIEFIRENSELAANNTIKNIFFLSADAFGVLPPVSKLTAEQAAYYFINGYTAKVAGTEHGINAPLPSFSACFGAPFMPLHPTVYSDMLMQKIKDNNINVWMLNTGWIGGPYGKGERIPLKYTRAIVNAIHDGTLGESTIEFKNDSILNLSFPKQCPGVPDEILDQSKLWSDASSYETATKQLAALFKENNKRFLK